MLPDYRVRQRDYLLEISRALTEDLDQHSLLERILRVSVDMLNGQAGFIALNDEEHGWELAVHHRIPAALQSYLEKGLQQLEGEENQDEKMREMGRMVNDISMGLLSGVGMVMRVQQQVIGQIYVFRNYRMDFTQNDRSILSSFANQAAIAVRNARLYKQVRDQNLRMEALLDSVADGIAILNGELRVVMVNQALERLLGQSGKQLINQQLHEVFTWTRPPQGVPIEESIATHWIKYTRSQRYLEGDLQRQGGMDPLPVAITYAPLVGEDGRLLNVIASVRDITRIRTAEEMKTSFISVVSHELKTPIAVIKGYASTLRRDDVQWDPAVVQESLSAIETEADRLTAMVEDLLDATRLQAGGIHLKSGEVELPLIAQELCVQLGKTHPQHQIHCQFPADFPNVVADEDRMRQLLSNLINNALKYAPAGEVIVSGTFDPAEVRVCVTDEGQGFNPEDIPHVFERFYRASGPSKTTKGTGLGLYLSKAIVDAHGGRIWIDESHKTGARICFSLPLRVENAVMKLP